MMFLFGRVHVPVRPIFGMGQNMGFAHSCGGCGWWTTGLNQLYWSGLGLMISTRKKYTEGPSTFHQVTRTSSNRKTRYTGSLNYTKPVTIGPSVVLVPVLSYVAVESA